MTTERREQLKAVGLALWYLTLLVLLWWLRHAPEGDFRYWQL